MALDGGGGGGGGGPISSSNPAGTGTGINYIGNHAYAYSGVFSASTTESNMLKFSTGNAYIMSEFCWGYNVQTGSDIIFRVKVDGQTVFTTIWADATITYGKDQPVPLLLPPFAEITVTADVVSGSNIDTLVTMVGRVYQ